MIRDEATLRQIEAADPKASTWLTANAGSGKTRVLTDRVARLLLDGTDPQNILCLTYTKAAASEMQNRLFKRLGEWAMMDDEPLRQSLGEMGVEGAIPNEALANARTLFARAVETPGGLKIQTIHSFCASILRRFPLEAGVSPNFAEMDDRTAAHLREAVLDEISSGPDGGIIDRIGGYISEGGIVELTTEIVRHRDRFSARPDKRHFNLPDHVDEKSVLSLAFLGDEANLIAAIVPALAAGSKTDQGAAKKLAPVRGSALESLEVLENVFLTGGSAKEPFSAKIGSFPTKATREAISELMPALEAFMGRVEGARDVRIALAAYRRTEALHDFAALFLPLYDEHKLARGQLDFDDLIRKTKELLSDTGVAAWVLFKLDGGIDHILVDEAQDTSPAQWVVIRLLTQEFAAGDGAAPNKNRTIFVVGDKKQSIYSFQGADPDGFDKMQEHFGGALGAIGQRLNALPMEHSFRSSPAILSLVDLVFRGERARGLDRSVFHRAFKNEMPGRVDLWPLVPKSDDAPDHDWHDPVDTISQEHHDLRLARLIAEEIKRIKEHERLPVEIGSTGTFAQRRITEGDILILVQRRSPLFGALIRACKAEGLEVAGADRLKIGEELAVRDILSLLKFLALPEDDLSLAEALKSPLFGWTEQELFTLAAKRPQGAYLWQALRDAPGLRPDTSAIINDLRQTSDFLRPFDLIARILNRHEGRQKLIARLGEEIEDGVDALLSQALTYEQAEIPSLTGFLDWMEGDEAEVKRQPDSAGKRLRVMTVHGSKGLEAPIVILPDTADRKPPRGGHILAEGATPVWRMAKDATPTSIAPAVVRGEERLSLERRRLLYVAMTRAEKWLIVAGAGEAKADESWHKAISDGMEAAEAVPIETPAGIGARYSFGDWSALSEAVAKPSTTTEAKRMDLGPIADLPLRKTTISPSDLGGAKVLPGATEGELGERALAAGTVLHRLLELLPEIPDCDREATAQRICDGMIETALAGGAGPLIETAVALIREPSLADIFTPDAICEVAFSAHLPALGDAPVFGTIDRLVVGPDDVLVIDYKSNRSVPNSPERIPDRILRQLGAYAAAMAQIYPDRTIRTAILWTEGRGLMEVPPDLTDAALGRAAVS
jgi:ATP-dependent helicase/nuclease subunit A